MESRPVIVVTDQDVRPGRQVWNPANPSARRYLYIPESRRTALGARPAHSPPPVKNPLVEQDIGLAWAEECARSLWFRVKGDAEEPYLTLRSS